MSKSARLLLALAALSAADIMAATPAADQGPHAADLKAIQAVLDAHGKAWTAGDALAAAAVVTEDAVWVSSTGKVTRGRPAIEQMHQDWFAGPLKGSRHHHPGTPDVYFVRPEVAIVDGDSYVGGVRDATGAELPASESRYTSVFVRGPDGRWQVAYFRSLGPKPAGPSAR